MNAIDPRHTRRPGRAGFKLGFLSRVYSPQFDPTVYRNTLDLFEAAEALGFDAGWVAQHHFGMESGRLPSPLVFLAAAAQRTRRIELGTGVVVLPFEPPLRLAEDAAVLDALSNGRLHLGLGSGFDPTVFAAFGQDIAQRRERFSASLQQLQHALAGQPLHDSGTLLQPPATSLLDRLWHATAQVEQVARQGSGLLLAPTTAVANATASQQAIPDEATLITRYRDHWRNTRGGEGQVSVVRALFPDRDRQSAIEKLTPDILNYVRRMRAIGRAEPEKTPSIEGYLQRLGVLYGHPEDIVAQLQHDTALPLADYLIVQVQTETTSHAQAVLNLQAVARHIAPALGWQAGVAHTESHAHST